jgi:hypothetical protein
MEKNVGRRLLNLASNDEIIHNQEAVKELAKKIDWRRFFALPKVSQDTKTKHNIIRWVRSKVPRYLNLQLFVPIFSSIIYW